MNKKKERLIKSKCKEINEILNGMELNDVFIVLGNVVLDIFYSMNEQIDDFGSRICGWLSQLMIHIQSDDEIDTGDQLAN